MKFNDAVTGFVLVLFGGAVAWRSQSFPIVASLHYGAGLFPTIVGLGLVVCGLMLIAIGLKERITMGPEWVRLGEWVHSPHHVVSVLMIPVGVILYILVSDPLGYFTTSVLLLFSWLAWLRVGWLRSLVIAVVVTLIIDVAFSHYLLVPLPRGIFQPLAWLRYL